MKKQTHEDDAIDYEPRLRMPKNEVISKICDKIKAIDGLFQKTIDSTEFGLWRRETENLLIHAFGPKAKQVNDFTEIHYHPLVWTRSTDPHPSFLRGLQSARECLLAIAKDVKEFYPDATETTFASGTATTTERDSKGKDVVMSSNVFVVHGHDEGMKSSVARFLEKLGLHPIILHEQPNAGKTIIEKFETNANVSFAIVLMSPDDEGRKKNKNETFKDRARQNVILELGYFIGRLGRSRVCALKFGEIEIPSDVLGVLYTPYDTNGGWKLQLVKELSEAGLPLDNEKITTALMS